MNEKKTKKQICKISAFCSAAKSNLLPRGIQKVCFDLYLPEVSS